MSSATNSIHAGSIPKHHPLQIARGIRLRVLEHTIAQNGGYLSQACSAAEILATLYTRIMQLGPSVAPLIPLPFPGTPGPATDGYFRGDGYNGPKAPDLDRFYFSPSHYSLVLYATLIEVGRLAPEGLAQFNQDGSTVEMIGAEHSPGMELMTGSLAQGLSQAAGVALGRKRRQEKGRVWVFMSDGEFQEGQTWEAVQTLSYYKLDNLGVYVDVNRQQCDGLIRDVMNIEPLDQRLRAFGARVYQVDGHDPEALAAPAQEALNGQPLFVLGATNPCQEMPILEKRAPKLHYVRFQNEEERNTYRRFLEEFRKE